MKKFLAIVMILCIALSLVACGDFSSKTPSIEETQHSSTATEKEFDEVILVDNDDITFKVKGLKYDGLMDAYSIKVFVENKTDKSVTFSCNDFSVNGYMVSSYFSSSVTAGKKENTEIFIFKAHLDEQGITEIEEVEFELEAHHIDLDNWEDYKEYFKDTFKLNFK